MARRPLATAALMTLPVAGGLWLALAEEPLEAPTRLSGDFVRRVDSLSADDPAVRSRAEAELLRYGTRGVDQTIARLSDDLYEPEDRPTVRRLRGALEGLIDEEEARATRVTMPEGITSLPAADAVLARRGNRLDLSAGFGDVPFRVSTGEHTFWEVADEIAGRLGVVPAGIRDNGAAPLLAFRTRSPKDDGRGVGYAGPFRLAAAIEPMSPGSVSARLCVLGEPRTRPLLLEYDADSLRLIDAAGNAAPAEGDRGEVAFRWRPGDGTAEIPISFCRPRASREPVLLTGTLTVTAVTADEWFSFPLDAESEQERDGLTARLQRIDFGIVGGVAVAVSVRYPGRTPDFRRVIGLDHSPAAMWLLGAETGLSETVFPASSSAEIHGEDLTLRYRFEADLSRSAATTLTLRVPRRVAVIPVRVEVPLSPAGR